MLSLAQVQAQVKTAAASGKLTRNFGHILNINEAYRNLKALGWQSLKADNGYIIVHPTDRVPVFELHGATIRRDITGEYNWILEIDGQAAGTSDDLVEITAQVEALAAGDDDSAPAPIDPIEAAAESILIENAPVSDAFRKRLASAAELVKAGITEFPHYQTAFEPSGFYGVRSCQCNDARHRSLYAPKIGTVCKHTLSQLLAERIRQQREAVADRKFASDLDRNRSSAHGNARDTALPASDNGRIEDMLGYDDGPAPTVAQQIAEVRAANWWAKPDPINRSAAGAGRSQFRARYGRG